MYDMSTGTEAFFPGRKRRILLVEDEFVNREILSACLESEYDIASADNGEAALGVIQNEAEALSLVLLDLNLPDIHGLEILRRMKEDPQTARIPVIVMTSEEDTEVECLDVGASDFISKPYPIPEVIRARVRRWKSSLSWMKTA